MPLGTRAPSVDHFVAATPASPPAFFYADSKEATQASPLRESYRTPAPSFHVNLANDLSPPPLNCISETMRIAPITIRAPRRRGFTLIEAAMTTVIIGVGFVSML